jgi:putative ABC transport system permease protein
MLKNYLKIALRSLSKQKVYTAINVLGLSTGVASCLLIVMYVVNEFSYDTFHSKSDRIYKIALERKYPNHSTNYAIIPHSYGDMIQTDFVEVESVVKMNGPFNNVGVSYKDASGNEKFFEENFVMAADSNFFSVFDFKIIKGDPQKMMKENTDLVITEETAKRYFGNDDPIGKTLRYFNTDFVVTAVCENIPENSHMKFDFLSKRNDPPQDNFTAFNAHVYVLLKPGADPAALETKFPKMVDTYAAAQIEANLGKSWEDYKKEGNGYRYFLQPLTAVHLDPTHIEAKMKPGGNLNYVYFLSCIAALILVIACINFMNLATARSAERAREVGVRKTMGSQKTQLVSQFLVESSLISFVATVIAIGIIYAVLPSFNNVTGKHLAFSFSPQVIGGLIFVTIAVGILAGSYPAFVLSSFNPVTVMKGKFMSNTKGSILRNGLVVFQFLISIVLIVGTIVVGEQMQFMHEKSLGFKKEQTIIVERVFALQNQSQTFIDEIREMPLIESAAGAFSVLGGNRGGDFFGEQWTTEGNSEILTSKTMTIDDDFTDMIGFELIDGKAFSKETNDSLSLMLNETAVKTFDITDPIGKKMKQVQRTPQGNITVEYTIVGVIKDFNFQSLHDPVTPLTIRNTESFGGGAGYAYARVKGENLSAALTAIEEKWKSMAPGQPFKYHFFDQILEAQYRSEQQAGKIFRIFSGLAVIIACVGLFGLSAYTANLRTKEIGVRKVLGASVLSVVMLLSKDFTKLIGIAFLIAVPAGWYMMNTWLEGFAYHIDLGPGVFILAGLTAVVIAWLTVSYQSIKAAIVNPVKSLRSE